MLVINMKSMFLIFSFVLLNVSESKFTRRAPERIVGGEEAIQGEFPWIVDIRFGSSTSTTHYCGGVIINANWIATAAHCAISMPDEFLVIVAGEHNSAIDEGTEQLRKIQQSVIHPNYERHSFANDIALMQMDSPFNLNLYVRSVVLPESNFEITGDVTAVGWGSTSEEGPSINTLMKVTLPIVPNQSCNVSYNGEVLDGMICAGTVGKDSCSGDSGGPLSGGNILVGITSWGIGCGQPGYPGVYVSVPHYVNWIYQVIT